MTGPGRERVRTPLVYGGLVVVPLALTTLLLATGTDATAPVTPAGGAGGEHVLVRLLVAAALIVAVCRLAGAVAGALGQPPVLGEIATGILLGPSVLGALWPGGTAWLLPDPVLSHLGVLAQLGVILFVFLAGLEIDLRSLRGRRRLALVVSHVSIAVPLLLGVAVALAVHSRFAPPGVASMPFALFMGVAMSVTALPVMARILMDAGLHRSRLGTLALTCALVDDLTAWCLLAVVIALVAAGGAAGVLTTIALSAGFAAAVLYGVRPLARRFGDAEPAAPVVLGGVLLAAACTDWIGVHAIFGAFLLGLALPADTALARRVRELAGGVTMVLLLPLFFAYSGLRTDLSLLGTDPVLWGWCALILLVAVAGKLGGASVAARGLGVSPRESLRIGALMNCRGLTEIVVLNIGLDLGVIGPELFTILVVMALVSTAMAAPIVRGARGAEERAPDPPDLPPVPPSAPALVSDTHR
ncbi:cation/H(+) antiporter [Actinomadura craniellae]|uniref:Cation/H(+) antiporter n=1 Tax=Actinomadura craniellae TaxID=2231787 RepID=A0A365HD14_9ACTN|nr:cation:proton antiporter [Actinomadura craniellae]RAY16153.1 cation/H(+) antiporter [Actinomadura craniellae]